MEHFLIRHTIRTSTGEAPLIRHYSVKTHSKEDALKVAYKIDDGDKPFTTVEVIGHVVNGWPLCDL